MYAVVWGPGWTAGVADDGEVIAVDAPRKEAAALRLALARPIDVRESVREGQTITEVVGTYRPGDAGHVKAVLRSLPGGVVVGP